MKPTTHKINSTLNTLKQYFSTREDVLMSFVFGSFIKGREHEGHEEKLTKLVLMKMGKRCLYRVIL